MRQTGCSLRQTRLPKWYVHGFVHHKCITYCHENSLQINALSVLLLYWHHVCLLCQSAVRVKLVAVQVVSDVLGHGIDFDAVITRLVLIGRLVY